MAKQSKSTAVKKIKFKVEKEPLDSSHQEEKITDVEQITDQIETEDFYGFSVPPLLDTANYFNSYDDIHFLAGSATKNDTDNDTLVNLTALLLGIMTDETPVIPKRVNYVQTVTVPVFLGLLAIAIFIYLFFRFPNKLLDILSDAPYLTWQEFYEEEMLKSGLALDTRMLEGGVNRLLEGPGRLQDYICETGIQKNKDSESQEDSSHSS